MDIGRFAKMTQFGQFVRLLLEMYPEKLKKSQRGEEVGRFARMTQLGPCTKLDNAQREASVNFFLEMKITKMLSSFFCAESKVNQTN